MYVCGKEIRQYHDIEVTLSEKQRREMRERRDSNRDRLTSGLGKNEDPQLLEQRTQGSYAMRTMIQVQGNDYDIDDGAYFDRGRLVGSSGGDKSALDARKMVRDAIDNGSFKTPPEVRNNCVRIHYEAGYHVDVPVYRRWNEEAVAGKRTFHLELASSDWKKSDPLGVTTWFNTAVKTLSPDDDVTQFRRVVRMLKGFSKSRSSWAGQTLSGFAISKLAEECFTSCSGNDEHALHKTMKSIKSRLDIDLSVKHPVIDELLAESNDPRARFFGERLDENLEHLVDLELEETSKSDAMKAWGKVFNSEFFNDQEAEAESSGLTESSELSKRFGHTDDISFVREIASRGIAYLRSLKLKVGYMQDPPWPGRANLPVELSASLHEYEDGDKLRHFASGEPIPQGLHIRFDAKVGNGALPPKWKIHWRVTNTGRAAATNRKLRGGYNVSKTRYRWEKSTYLGVHWVEAFVVNDRGVCMGKSDQFFVVINDEVAHY